MNSPYGPYTSIIGVIAEAAKWGLEVVSKGKDPSLGIVKSISKWGSRIGWTGEAISISINIVNAKNNPNWNNAARLNASIGIAALNLIPAAGPILSFVGSAIDAAGGFNGYYQWCGELEQFYRNNNLSPWDIAIPSNLSNPAQSNPSLIIKLF